MLFLYAITIEDSAFSPKIDYVRKLQNASKFHNWFKSYGVLLCLQGNIGKYSASIMEKKNSFSIVLLEKSILEVSVLEIDNTYTV